MKPESCHQFSLIKIGLLSDAIYIVAHIETLLQVPICSFETNFDKDTICREYERVKPFMILVKE